MTSTHEDQLNNENRLYKDIGILVDELRSLHEEKKAASNQLALGNIEARINELQARKDILEKRLLAL